MQCYHCSYLLMRKIAPRLRSNGRFPAYRLWKHNTLYLLLPCLPGFFATIWPLTALLHTPMLDPASRAFSIRCWVQHSSVFRSHFLFGYPLVGTLPFLHLTDGYADWRPRIDASTLLGQIDANTRLGRFDTNTLIL